MRATSSIEDTAWKADKTGTEPWRLSNLYVAWEYINLFVYCVIYIELPECGIQKNIDKRNKSIQRNADDAENKDFRGHFYKEEHLKRATIIKIAYIYDIKNAILCD